MHAGQTCRGPTFSARPDKNSDGPPGADTQANENPDAVPPEKIDGKQNQGARGGWDLAMQVPKGATRVERLVQLDYLKVFDQTPFCRAFVRLM